MPELILNVDDLGLHRDLLPGVEELWANRCVSTVSVFSTSDILDDTITGLKKIGIPVGVHLILDGDKPLLAKGEIPSLVDERGFFRNDVTEIRRRLKPQEAFNELSAQIENILKRDMTISHLDSHRGLCLSIPKLWKVYRELGKRYSVPLALPKYFFFHGTRRCVADSSDSYIGIHAIKQEENLGNRLRAYERMLSTLGAGRHYCFSHPAPPTQSIKESLTDYRIRNDDYALFISPEWKELLRKYNITLSSFFQTARGNA